MNLINRYKKPTPKFFRILRNIGILLVASGGAILAVPIALPQVVVTIAAVMTIAGTVASAVSQAVVSDTEEEERNSEINKK